MECFFILVFVSKNAFENLNPAFCEVPENDQEIQLEISTNPQLTLSFAIVLYQLIRYSSKMPEEDINLVADKK